MKKYIKIIGLFISLFFTVSTIVNAQEINIDRLTNVDIDSYSDKQIETYWNKAQQQGYDLNQLEIISKSKGMSAVQFSKLKSRILNLKTNSSVNIDSEKNNSEITSLEKFGLDGSEFQDNVKEEKLFGYDFFNNPSISFTPNLNLATPTTYQLGPGDEILIDIWGASENSYRKKVSREGAIRIEGVGPVYVSGLSIEKAKKKIISYLKKIYNGIEASSDSYNKVYAEVSLVNVRTVQVNIIGEVKAPGSYSLNALSTVLNALYASGGPTKNGTFRNIKIIRDGKEYTKLDIYKYLLYGSEEGNILLQDQDIINVQPYENKIEVKGEVKRKGIFELKKEENLQDLINYFSGFTAEAYKERLLVERVNGKEKEVAEILLTQQKDFVMQDGDKLTISKIIDRFKNKVSIGGAVYRPGDYELTKDLDLSELFQKAEGIKENAFLDRGLIYRTIDDVEQEVVPFSVKQILENKVNVTLKREDSIHVFDKSTLKEVYTLTINGAINTPQTIPFVDKMMVEDFIAISGGFKEGADVTVIDISRRLADGNFKTISQDIRSATSKNLENLENNLYLQPFDIVSVRYLKGYSSQIKVTIKGEVSYPGAYAITNKEERISDLIKKAGGFSPYAYLKGAAIYRKKTGIDRQKQLKLYETLEKKDSLLEIEEKRVDFKIAIDLIKIMKEGGRQSPFDLILKEGDELVIPSQKQTVEIQGEVLAPSLVNFDPSKSLKKYINNSGGFSPNAQKRHVYVVYANGNIKTTKRFLFFKWYPEIEPGATILVPKNKERKKLSTQEVLGITTSLATLGILIRTLTN